MNVLGIIILVAVIIIVWFIVYAFMREENEPTMKYHLDGNAPYSGHWEIDKTKEKNKKSGLRVFFSSIGVTAIVLVLIFLIGKCTSGLGIGDDEPYVNDAHTYDRY